MRGAGFGCRTPEVYVVPLCWLARETTLCPYLPQVHLSQGTTYGPGDRAMASPPKHESDPPWLRAHSKPVTSKLADKWNGVVCPGARCIVSTPPRCLKTLCFLLSVRTGCNYLSFSLKGLCLHPLDMWTPDSFTNEVGP